MRKEDFLKKIQNDLNVGLPKDEFHSCEKIIHFSHLEGQEVFSTWPEGLFMEYQKFILAKESNTFFTFKISRQTIHTGSSQTNFRIFSIKRSLDSVQKENRESIVDYLQFQRVVVSFESSHKHINNQRIILFFRNVLMKLNLRSSSLGFHKNFTFLSKVLENVL